MSAAIDSGVPGALGGVKVLDLAMLFPAPLIAAMLGDFGADVVKVEPKDGDLLRRTGVMRNGHSAAFAMTGRNKRSLRLDFDRPEGLALLHRLTVTADVIVVNQAAPLLERWGCSHAALAQRNPRAVIVALSAYGNSGPRAGEAGNGTLAEAYAGISSMVGEADGPPMLLSIPLGDVMGAINGLVGTLVALYWRDARGGEGQLVDVSLYDALLPLLGSALAAWQDGTPPPKRNGSRMQGAIPRNTYRTRDGRWVAVSASTDAQLQRILKITDADTPENQARFGDAAGRVAHTDELDALMGAWIAAHDCGVVLDLLTQGRISVAEINDLGDVMRDAHVKARGSITILEDPNLGPLKLATPAPRLSKTPGRIVKAAPALGGQTEAVCRDWLGLNDGELAALRSAGAI